MSRPGLPFGMPQQQPQQAGVPMPQRRPRGAGPNARTASNPRNVAQGEQSRFAQAGLVPMDDSGRKLPYGAIPPQLSIGEDGMPRGGNAFGRSQKMQKPPGDPDAGGPEVGAVQQLAALKKANDVMFNDPMVGKQRMPMMEDTAVAPEGMLPFAPEPNALSPAIYEPAQQPFMTGSPPPQQPGTVSPLAVPTNNGAGIQAPAGMGGGGGNILQSLMSLFSR